MANPKKKLSIPNLPLNIVDKTIPYHKFIFLVLLILASYYIKKLILLSFKRSGFYYAY